MNLLWQIPTKLSQFKKRLDRRLDETGAPIITFGIFGAINFPLFYLIWLMYGEGEFTNLTMRVIVFLLCIPLILKNYWPAELKKILSIYWYSTVLFSLPFFGTYMFLIHHASTIWLTNAMVGLFWLILVVDWLSFTILLPLGVALGIAVFLLQGNPIYFESENITGTFLNYLWAIVIAAVFAHNREKLQKAKLHGMETLSASIAHELRTPLRAITSGASSIKKYLVNLIETYKIASKKELDIPYIDPLHYQSLMPAFNSIEVEAKSAFTFIDMLLVKVRQPGLKSYQFEIYSIAQCVEEALNRYPFASRELEFVHWQRNQDFMFKGNQLLIIHVLFNLIKNALYYLKVAGKGEIEIWVSKTPKYNILHFKDTGTGISPKILPHIFDRFVTETQHGTGIGLAFCKYAMKSQGGDISCNSIEGQYTEFKLMFPPLPKSHHELETKK